ncbi:hypothetical protein EDD18DRAFT_71479 [Armillaria luteobubalina]|uniref:Uncharacterized protein n=1 Tax=Armillaria luteobubalina TaxID=153913 RepID=A0AA39U9E5_9AGAR|nr:hypothetical protein EDD18DRAFT_71479 [Armillaria luteobubalina]
MQLVDNDKFLQKLSELFESSSKDNGSIWLTHKQLTHGGEDTAMKYEEGEGDVSSGGLHKCHSVYGYSVPFFAFSIGIRDFLIRPVGRPSMLVVPADADGTFKRSRTT